jgi:hypothetical protein
MLASCCYRLYFGDLMVPNPEQPANGSRGKFFNGQVGGFYFEFPFPQILDLGEILYPYPIGRKSDPHYMRSGLLGFPSK